MAGMTKKASAKVEGKSVKAKRALAEVERIKTKMHHNKRIEAADMAEMTEKASTTAVGREPRPR